MLGTMQYATAVATTSQVAKIDSLTTIRHRHYRCLIDFDPIVFALRDILRRVSSFGRNFGFEYQRICWLISLQGKHSPPPSRTVKQALYTIIMNTWTHEYTKTKLANCLGYSSSISYHLPPNHIAGGHLNTRSREVSKPRDSCLDFSNRSDTWQAARQQRCRDAHQIAGRNNHNNIESRGFEMSWELAARRLNA